MLGQKRKVECEGEVVEKKPSIDIEEDGMDEWNKFQFSAIPPVVEGAEEKKRWRNGNLCIYQTSTGFTFFCSTHDNSHPGRTSRELNDKIFGYRYEIDLMDDGDYVEKRSIQRSFGGDQTLFHSKPLPDAMINAIRTVLNTYQPHRVKLEKIILDLKSLAKLEWLLANKDFAAIDLSEVKFDHMTDHHRKKFVALIRASGVRHLYMNGTDQLIHQGILTESFVVDLANSSLERFHSNVTAVDAYPLIFKPSKDILPAICHFESFEAPSLVLKREYLIELIVSFLDGLDPIFPMIDCNWRFALDLPFTPKLLETNTKRPQIEAILHEGDVYVIKRSNKYTARLDFKPTPVDGGRARMNVVYVKCYVGEYN